MSSERQDHEFVTAQSMGADFTTTPIFIEAMDRFSMQLTYTGSPVGRLVLQFSNDGVNFATADGATGDTTEDVTTAGNTMYIVADNGARWVRVRYTRTSGTGSITGTFHGNDDR